MSNLSAEQVLAEKFSKNEISLDEFMSSMTVLRNGGGQEAEAPKAQRLPVDVDLSDDYKFGHVMVWKTTPAGKRLKGIGLHIDDVDGIVAEIQAVAELVRADLSN